MALDLCVKCVCGLLHEEMKKRASTMSIANEGTLENNHACSEFCNDNKPSHTLARRGSCK